ncbi:hypothetical protein FVEG_08532 [Fusarium verticillioides 7600]|uniref:Uncharacterized protein n=1 Tax=Gibberella moniliformis (strain M3125 / FGSC 7600) TaxID=334819 RepID=W7MBL4_GIBM7|nr:hypothetical protein FVEG_08532 [Fusarium verticillioides 7600]XP_018755070.1 hypothetical protein FVEG_08532 [Fusarium verticillioides 7600]EWG48878.1 hypothetical protein FVEG_08532 [Fusarium verticillioides 7600]EWG48879.1 hypothetical protein FVEG_08532 [Fusarium verticillioides 7600]
MVEDYIKEKLTCYGACHRPNEYLPHVGFGQKSLYSIAAGLGWDGLVLIATTSSHLVMEAILGGLTFGLAGGKDVLYNLHVVPPGNSAKPEPMQRRNKPSEYLEQTILSLVSSITEQFQIDRSINTPRQLKTEQSTSTNDHLTH